MADELGQRNLSQARRTAQWQVPVLEKSCSQGQPHPRLTQQRVIVEMEEHSLRLIAFHDDHGGGFRLAQSFGRIVLQFVDFERMHQRNPT